MPLRFSPSPGRPPRWPVVGVMLAALLSIQASASGADVAAPDEWSREMAAPTHLAVLDATQNGYWQLYARDSNAGATVFQPRTPGAGTLNLWIGDGHRPRALPPVPYQADVQPWPITVSSDASHVLVGLYRLDATGHPQTVAIEVISVHPVHGQPAPVPVPLPTPLAVRQACFLPEAEGGGIALLACDQHSTVWIIDAHQSVRLLATTQEPLATLTPVPKRPTVWLGDGQGLHAVDLATGRMTDLLPRGEDDAPRYLPVFTPDGQRAVVVRYGMHSNRVTCTAITVATGATQALPGSFQTEAGVLLMHVDPHRFVLAEGDMPLHATGVAWSVGFAAGDIHRQP